MSATGTSSNGAWPPRRSFKRGKLRNGTFVIPSTGERSRRQFTLRTSSSLSSGNASSYRPSDVAETAGERFRAYLDTAKQHTLAAWRWLDTDEGHGVLKCTLAYFLGSMATFWPPLANFLGQRDGKHVVATLTVYFHPARTAGSMIEAVLIAIAAIAYAESVCLFSMAIVIVSRTTFGLITPAHIAVLLVCVGGGLGFVGWVKQRLNYPLVNTATTLASISIITVITKEEAVQDGYFSAIKIIQVLKMLLIGVSFSVAVNLLVWHVSARKVLRKSVIAATMSLSDKLSYVARGFLNGSEDELNSPDYARVNAQYDKAYSVISTTTREAKFEYYFVGREKIYQLDKRLVKSMEAVAQAIGGLRSALNTQFVLMEEAPSTDTVDSRHGSFSAQTPKPRLTRAMSDFMDDARERLAVIDEMTDESDADDIRTPFGTESEPNLDKSPLFRAPSDIFSLFIALLGPSMKSLAYTLSEILREPAFGENPTTEVTVNDQLRESLRDALNLYNHARGTALQELYRSIELGRSRSEKIQADIEEVAAACGHFSFSLQAVAEDMDSYLDVLEELKHVTETSSRSWQWLMFWKYWGRSKRNDEVSMPDPEQEALLSRHTVAVKPLRKSAVPKGIPSSMTQRKDSFSWDAAPHSSSFMRNASQGLLKFLRFLVREDIIFGVKVGIGAVLWAMFAFLDSTRPVYQHWRGEWGLLSFMIVVGMTTGAANTTGTSRFKGTIIGGVASIVSWLIGQENPFVLALCGAIMAFANFYMILVVKNGPLGRISLLAYNVIVLYAYTISQKVDDDDDDEGGSSPLIWEIAYHRAIAVTLGILWGIFICRFLWPISGREKFREGLSVLYLQMGLIWKRGPLRIKAESSAAEDYMREGEQAALQRYAFKLDSLRNSAKSEFELRGPFPDQAYGRIMTSTRHILDGFYAMRLITQKRHNLSPGERALIEFTTAERDDLCRRVCHVFQVLASCLMLEYPLTDAIPTIDSTKDRLLGRIYRFRKAHMEAISDASSSSGGEGNGETLSAEQQGDRAVAEERDYALLYAYTLVSAQVAEELKKVRYEIEGLFGVLNEDSLLLE